jgi:hypothetical protein
MAKPMVWGLGYPFFRKHGFFFGKRRSYESYLGFLRGSFGVDFSRWMSYLDVGE